MNEMNWDDLRLFLAVARAGGLGPAEGKIGKSAPTLGRRMLALERILGQELFDRHPRGYALTEQGRALFSRAEVVEQAMSGLAPSALGPAPMLVKISAGTWVSHLLCQHARELADRSVVRLRFIAADEALDMRRREAVIGIRNRPPEDLALAAQRLSQVRFAWFARSPDVQDCAVSLGATPSAKWAQAAVPMHNRVEVAHPRNALDLAMAGTARALLPTFIGVRQSALQQIGKVIEDLTHDQWLVTHGEDRHLPPIRSVIDRTCAVLKAAIN